MGHKTTLLVRGGGDLASGVIHRLYKCGYQVLVLECRKPSAIRRKVSFGEAVFDGISSVEGVTGRLIEDVSECQKVGCTDRCNPCEEKSWNNKRDGSADRCVGAWI